MRPYHAYAPDEAFLLPPSFTDLISAGDPVHVVRRAVDQLDLSAALSLEILTKRLIRLFEPGGAVARLRERSESPGFIDDGDLT